MIFEFFVTQPSYWDQLWHSNYIGYPIPVSNCPKSPFMPEFWNQPILIVIYCFCRGGRINTTFSIVLCQLLNIHNSICYIPHFSKGSNYQMWESLSLTMLSKCALPHVDNSLSLPFPHFTFLPQPHWLGLLRVCSLQVFGVCMCI